MFLAERGHLEIMEVLLRREKIDVNLAMKGGTTSLYVAAKYGHLAVVELLLRRKDINVNLAMNDGASPLLVAAEKGN